MLQQDKSYEEISIPTHNKALALLWVGIPISEVLSSSTLELGLVSCENLLDATVNLVTHAFEQDCIEINIMRQRTYENLKQHSK